MPSNDLTKELPPTQRAELEVSYSPRRRRRIAIALAALSALFIVAGVLASTMLPPLDRSGDEAPAAPTPRDLVTDGLGDAIPIETQAPTIDGSPTRSTAVVHGEQRGITFACELGTSPDGTIDAGGIYDLSCAASSVGGFEGRVSFSCDTPDWVVCDRADAGGYVAPDVPYEARWTVAPRDGAPAGLHTFTMFASAAGATYDDVIAFSVRGPGEPVEAFVCNVLSSVVLAGDSTDVRCTFFPAGFRGTLHPVCVAPDALTSCDVPDVVNVSSDDPVSFTGSWTFDVMASPGDYGPLTVSLPARDRTAPTVTATISPTSGTFTLDCPSAVTTVLGELQTTCTATSVGGFDGNVRFTPVVDADIDALVGEPIVVRVKPGSPVDVPIELVSGSPLPIGAFPNGLLIRGETATLTVDSDGILVHVS